MGTLQKSDMIILRIKCLKATNIRIETDTKAPLSEFTDRLEKLTQVPASSMVLLKGFPPKGIFYNRNTGTVSDLGLQTQDTLIVEFLKNVTSDIIEPSTIQSSGVSVQQKPVFNSNLTSSFNSSSSSKSPVVTVPDTAPNNHSPQSTQISGNQIATIPEAPPSSAGNTFELPSQMLAEETQPEPEDIPSGLLMRHVVPADNSCLFTSVAFCLSDVERIQGTDYLRQVIATTVAKDPVKYNEAFLGRSNADYCRWIKLPDSWGGGIEVSILSEFYGREITVVNIQSSGISRFGEDKNYSQRFFLLYDGIHYDPLYMEMFLLDERRKLFATSDTDILQQALQLAEEANRAHHFTDVKNFQLRCNRCNTLLKGNSEAQQHAKSTGHVDFSEIV